MYRIALPSCLAVIVGGTLAWADNPPALREVQVLQEAMQTAIHDAEPAIACILVSRSDEYIKLGETPPPDGSGKLGGFDVIRAKNKNPISDEAESNRIDKQLNMAHEAYVPESYGSGVVIDERGLILTNEHVIRDATKIYVRLPGGKGSYCDIHAADQRSDLAVLRPIKPLGRLKAIKLGDGGKVRKGQFVMSLANPFAAGFRDGSPSASWGIISNVRRRPAGSKDEADRSARPLYQHGILLQSDVRLNVGCSGGALIDLKGELIGLTTAVAALAGTETAGGYALPIDDSFKRIIEVLKRGEEVEYGFLGVQLGGLPNDFNPGFKTEGVRIGQAIDGSAAARGGIRAGDLILSVGGMPTNDYDDLFLAISTQLAGTRTRVEISNGAGLPPRVVMVTLDKAGPYGKSIVSHRPPAPRGLRVDFLSVLGQNLPRGITFGVVIREVQAGSAGANAMLKVNDIITHVKGQAIQSPADFYRKMQGLTGAVDLTLANSQQVTLN